MPPPSTVHIQEETAALFQSSAVFVRRYLGLISLISCVLIIAIFWGFNARNHQLLRDQLLHEARAFFQEIVQTRQWIINQEGVYVKQKGDMQIDPILANLPGITPEIKAEQGNFLLRSHAAITRNISQLGQEERAFSIFITSLNPLSPLNEPDLFEQESLEQFENGVKENYLYQTNVSGEEIFRYMAPLTTEKECLICHGAQGYKIGDIRGGISISIPATAINDEMSASLFYTILSASALLVLLLSVILYISQHFINDLKQSEKRLYQLATTDSLTSLLNRGEGIRRFQQEISLSIRKQVALSVIILDIDHFKKINDNFGHQVGDQVIQTIADILTSTLRNYDIVCRYGGEEYLIVLPATELPKAVETAERLRHLIEETIIETGTRRTTPIKITASFGVTSLQSGDSLDGLIYRADNALYIAKEDGRNQVRHIK
ncbi:MAG: diguanylate cyclase [Proteobacteria bacterium]|nr:diguanylate cyclase [Pseudomonadota bacterium]MBU1687033.1 diguanylate cyclase [Pseudomonadota bacterium]